MTYGLIVKGSHGLEQIENARSTFVAKSSGLINSNTAHSTILGLCSPSNGEMLLVRPVSGTGRIGWTSSLRIVCSTGQISYLVVVPSKNLGPSSQNYGLRTFDASGGVLFDSGYRLAKPLATTSISRSGATNPQDYYTQSTVTLPSPIGSRLRYVDFSFLTRLHGWSIRVMNGDASYSRIDFDSATQIRFGSERVYDGQNYQYVYTRSYPVYATIMEY